MLVQCFDSAHENAFAKPSIPTQVGVPAISYLNLEWPNFSYLNVTTLTGICESFIVILGLMLFQWKISYRPPYRSLLPTLHFYFPRATTHVILVWSLPLDFVAPIDFLLIYIFNYLAMNGHVELRSVKFSLFVMPPSQCSCRWNSSLKSYQCGFSQNYQRYSNPGPSVCSSVRYHLCRLHCSAIVGWRNNLD